MARLRRALAASICCAVLVPAPAAAAGNPAASSGHTTAVPLVAPVAVDRDQRGKQSGHDGKQADRKHRGKHDKDTRKGKPSAKKRPPVRGAAKVHIARVAGTRPRVVLTGPRGFSRVLRGSARLKRLAPGKYRLSADRVAKNGGVVRARVTPARFRLTRKQPRAAARVRYRFTSTAGDVTTPGPATGLRLARRAPTTILLAWDAPADADLAGTIVRRSANDVPPASPAQGVEVSATQPFDGLAADGGLTPGTTYSYSVFTQDSHGNTNPTAVSITVRTPVTDVFAAGDIGWCGGAAARTSRLIPNGSPFLALGDIAYFSGTTAEYNDCYRPHYGRLRSTTYPTPGNHEHRSKTVGYRKFFGDRVGTRRAPWYSVRFGSWLFLMLDSNCRPIGGCGRQSRQYQWALRQTQQHDSTCLAAAWHHPRWGTGEERGDGRDMDETYRMLDNAGTDVLLAGHLHRYERFARTGPEGKASVAGIRQFVVGTGGAPLLGIDDAQPTLESVHKSHGVLRLSLDPNGFSWEFIDTDSTVLDRGSDVCDPGSP